MSKDEFNKRLTHTFSTPEKRRELYVKIHKAIPFLPVMKKIYKAVPFLPDMKKIPNSIMIRIMNDYDNKSETEQVVTIQKRIKLIYNCLKFGTPFLFWILCYTSLGLGARFVKTLLHGFKADAICDAVGFGAAAVYSFDLNTEKIYSTFMKKTGLDKL